VEGSEVRQRDGEDFYGREQHMTIGVLSGWHGTVKPDTVVCDGTLLYPQGSEIDEGLFARRISVSVVFNYDENGKLKGGSGKEEFSGRVKTSDGVLQYQGDGTGTFIVQDGQLAWTQRTEITTYTYNDKPYAQTVTVITPESEYLGGRWVTVREVYLTETTYENGSQRQSEIQVITERNQFGTITGKSGNGTVTGTELVNGSFVDYTGHITLEYMFDSGRYGWMKASYHEQRSATLTLPEWLPFEVITIDDSDFRPIF
jgi:hypothetical protein